MSIKSIAWLCVIEYPTTPQIKFLCIRLLGGVWMQQDYSIDMFKQCYVLWCRSSLWFTINWRHMFGLSEFFRQKQMTFCIVIRLVVKSCKSIISQCECIVLSNWLHDFDIKSVIKLQTHLKVGRWFQTTLYKLLLIIKFKHETTDRLFKNKISCPKQK